MFRLTPIIFLLLLLSLSSCRDRSRALEQDASEATIASETGASDPALAVPTDAIAVTKPLINGVLYESPSFESKPITQFDTSQQLFLLDTTDIMFVRARLIKDTTTYTGYISKAILPEKD